MLFLGVVTCAAVVILASFALLRGAILLLAGATDRRFFRDVVPSMLYGEVSIGASPAGTIAVTTVSGDRLLSHTTIYDHPDVIAMIVSKIKSAVVRPPHPIAHDPKPQQSSS
jgi:hypothetical protein